MFLIKSKYAFTNKTNQNSMLTLLLILTGLLGFVLFFKSIDFFDKI